MSHKRALLKIGQTITSRNWKGQVNDGVIVGFSQKNGRKTVDYETADGGSFWCYLEQIEKVGGVQTDSSPIIAR